MFEIKKGIARPADKQAGGQTLKYPLDKMEVGDYFVVPQDQKRSGDTDKKFRDRINQSVRTYKQGRNKRAHLEPGYDKDKHVDLDFTVLTLGNPPEDQPDAWEAGDVGVWRDA